MSDRGRPVTPAPSQSTRLPPRSLGVEPQELINRAKELAEAMPQWPGCQPTAPCKLAMVKNAVTVLQRSSDNISMALKAGEERWRRLAQLLVDAARKYEGVDNAAAGTLTSTFENPAFPATLKPGSTYRLEPDAIGTFVPPPTTASWVGDGSKALLTQSDTVFLRVREAATQINDGDPRAPGLLLFSDQWAAYEGKLRDAALRFRPFESWRGTAVTQVEKQFEAHRTWLNQMAANCALISQQARGLASAHYVAVNQHPKPAQVEPLYAKLTAKRISSRDYEAYKRLQKLSEDVRTEYRKQAGLPFSLINLSMPPDRADADLLKTPEEKAREIADRQQQRSMQPIHEMLKAQKEEAEKGREEVRKARQEAQDMAREAQEKAHETAREAQEQAQEAQKAMSADLAKSMGAQQAALAKSAGAGMPKLPTPSKLMGAAGKLANMAKGMGAKPPAAPGKPGAPLIPPLPVGGHVPHVTPAASAGSGVSLGASGINVPPVGAATPPRLQSPLSPPVQGPGLPDSGPRPAPASELAARPPGSPSDAAGPHAPKAGGMPPMPAAPPQDQSGGKAKRVQPDDPTLYTEERPWTEGVIGRRPRKPEPAPPPPADGAK